MVTSLRWRQLLRHRGWVSQGGGNLLRSSRLQSSIDVTRLRNLSTKSTRLFFPRNVTTAIRRTRPDTYRQCRNIKTNRCAQREQNTTLNSSSCAVAPVHSLM